MGFAIVGAIVRGARVWAWVSVAVCWGVALLVSIVSGVQVSPGRIAAVTLGVLVLMGVGEAVRTRCDQLEQMRHTIADRRQGEVVAERVRIARELHDVLAHSLSQINVQARVGLHLMASQPERAADALASIKSTSKIALDEVRTVLGILRADADAEFEPEPDLARLGGLLESMAVQGLTVTLDNALSSVPPAAVQLAIYRIVQESLTNAARHSGSDSASITLS